MSSHTVIDGYNLLFRADEDDAGDGPTLQERREAFLRRVDAARTAGETVTVVFDGAPVRNAPAPATPGLSVRFACSPRSADDLIVSLVRRASGEQVTVLTHDRELGRRVRAAGGILGDPAAFFRLAKRGSAPPATDGGARKPPAPRGEELDAWERLFEEGPAGD